MQLLMPPFIVTDHAKRRLTDAIIFEHTHVIYIHTRIRNETRIRWKKKFIQKSSF